MKHIQNIIIKIVVLSIVINQIVGQTEESCDSLIYCQGKLLDVVQMSGVFNDSKTFVDLHSLHEPNKTLENFNKFLNETNNNPGRTEIRQFLSENFDSGNEFISWTPDDYTEEPQFLTHIVDDEIRDFAKEIVKIWPTLARKIKEDVFQYPDRYSLIPVPNGFIIPGGRFREFYYWDSYWIIKGLLLCNMTETVKGMLENFVTLIDRYGFIPNGARVYYLNRSQPPLFTAMVNEYLKKTKDMDFLKKIIGTIERELEYFIENKMVVVEKNGIKYNLAHYNSKSGTPRPESYREDKLNAQYFESDNDKRQFYAEIKSAAESGWDFSSRWFINNNDNNTNSNLSHIQTRRFIPVDLNAFLCQAFRHVATYHIKLNNLNSAMLWYQRSATIEKAIEDILYDTEDGTWYDYDIKLQKLHKSFYPSNLSPLWAKCYNPLKSKLYADQAVKYLLKQGILEYLGGTPASLIRTGEQWDLPNAWPPSQGILIYGLEQTGYKKAQDYAEQLAKNWLRSNMIGYNNTNQMFEKYDAEHPGQYGGGGEYQVQAGFGWTNGLILQIINTYFID